MIFNVSVVLICRSVLKKCGGVIEKFFRLCGDWL